MAGRKLIRMQAHILCATPLLKDGLITEHTKAVLVVTERYMAGNRNINALTKCVCNFVLFKTSLM